MMGSARARSDRSATRFEIRRARARGRRRRRRRGGGRIATTRLLREAAAGERHAAGTDATRPWCSLARVRGARGCDVVVDHTKTPPPVLICATSGSEIACDTIPKRFTRTPRVSTFDRDSFSTDRSPRSTVDRPRPTPTGAERSEQNAPENNADVRRGARVTRDRASPPLAMPPQTPLVDCLEGMGAVRELYPRPQVVPARRSAVDGVHEGVRQQSDWCAAARARSLAL